MMWQSKIAGLLALTLCASIVPASEAQTNPLARIIQGYTAFGDSIGEGCCVSGGVVTQSSLTNNVATLTVTSTASQPIPMVGDLIGRVSSTTNGAGIFNRTTEVAITAIGGGFANPATYNGETGSVTGTISFPLTHADVPAAAENGSMRAATYVNHIASQLGLAVINKSVGGSSCADMATNVFKTVVPTTSYALYTNDDGVNDIGAMMAGSPRDITKDTAQFQSCVASEDIFLATPSTLIKLANSAAASAAGWSTSTLKDPYLGTTDIGGGLAPSFEMMSNTNGSNFTATVNGTAVAVGYEITASDQGTAQVFIDGGTPSTISTYPASLGAVSNAVSLVRSGNVVTASGIPSGFAVNTWIVVQNASDPTFNGTFILQTVSGTSATWKQTAADGSASAVMGANSCPMSQTKFARTFSPQVLIVTGLSAGQHQVEIIVTSPSGTGKSVYIDYIAGNDAVTQTGGPVVVRTGVERTKSQWIPDSLSISWDTAAKAAVSQASSAGWNILFADIRAEQDSINAGNISPYMFAELGATGTFTQFTTSVTGVSQSITALMKTGTPIDDNSNNIRPGSSIATVGTGTFTLKPPTGQNGALRTGTSFFNIFDMGVHPNNQGHLHYYADAILNALAQ